MPAEVIVAFTVSGLREKYLRQALESWSRVRGADDAHFIFCVEPRPSFPARDFSWWAADAFHRTSFTWNQAVLGCLANTRQAFDDAFTSGARLGVMAEEDLVVSADVLEYLTWAMEAYEKDQDVAAVCAHAKDGPLAGDYDGAVVRAPWFSPLVCGTWKDRWEGFIRPGWRGYAAGPWDNAETSQAWDTNLRQMVREAGRHSVFPVRSRVTHVGEYSTWLTPSVAEFTFADSVSGCFAPDHAPGEYREVPFESVPGLRV